MSFVLLQGGLPLMWILECPFSEGWGGPPRVGKLGLKIKESIKKHPLCKICKTLMKNLLFVYYMKFHIIVPHRNNCGLIESNYCFGSSRSKEGLSRFATLVKSSKTVWNGDDWVAVTIDSITKNKWSLTN